MVFWNSEECLDYFGIELRAGTPLYFLAPMRHRKGTAIRAVAQHGIESIGDGDDACSERNLFTAQATWIARTIEELVVGEDDFRGVAEKGNARQHVVADFAVRVHNGLFIIVERAGLAQDGIRDGHFADVVEKGGAREHGQVGKRHGNGLGDRNRENSDALGMARGFRVFKVKSAAESFEGGVLRLSEKCEGFGRFRGFLFHFIHDGVPPRHHYMVGHTKDV